MGIAPVVWYLIPCKREPTVAGADPSVHDILYSIQLKEPAAAYPAWLRTFYVFALATDGRGECEFQVEVRLVRWDNGSESESIVGRSVGGRADMGTEPLRFRFLSLMMQPIRLPEAGVYRVYLICNGSTIGQATILAR